MLFVDVIVHWVFIPHARTRIVIQIVSLLFTLLLLTLSLSLTHFHSFSFMPFFSSQILLKLFKALSCILLVLYLCHTQNNANSQLGSLDTHLIGL